MRKVDEVLLLDLEKEAKQAEAAAEAMDRGEDPRFVAPEEIDSPELYGFRWGPAVVYRDHQYEMGSHRTTRVVKIQPDEGSELEVHISSTGKSIRVFRNGKELSCSSET